MTSKQMTKVGIQGGLLAGAFIALFFFLSDLVRLQPLSTPLALGGHLFGPNFPNLDMPVVSQVVAITVFAGNVLTLTILHFLAFSLLGIGAVRWCAVCGIRGNIVAGALYGFLVGSIVFYTCLAVGGDYVLANLPGPWSVAFANVMAGAVMGGFVQFAQSRPTGEVGA
jgi:hypothetical protein